MTLSDQGAGNRSVELEPLPVVNTAKLIQERLIQFIRGNGLCPGERLPSENDIAKRLGIGRPALREALHSLQTLGLVEVRAGSGWYAAAPSFDAMAKQLVFALEPNEQTRKELHRIRGILECAFLCEAVAGLTPADFSLMRRLVALMEMLAMAGQPYAEQDRDFHLTLFSHVTNDFFHRFVEACWTFGMARLPFDPTATLDQQITSAGRHRSILDAIEAGDLNNVCKLLEVHSIRDAEMSEYSADC
jgi:DNA-binding FadR family transcriptional regulator